MDVFVLKALADDLQQHLVGALVTKVFQPDRDAVLLRFWRGRDLRLMLSVATGMQRLHLTAERGENPPRPPRFAAFLRARLRRMRLRELCVLPYDRIVRLVLASPTTTEPELTLVHELIGPQANIMLLDHHDMILDALKHVSPERALQRTIMPGQPYQAPACPPQRLRIDQLTCTHLRQLYGQERLQATHLQRLLIGISPVLAAELLHRSQGEAQRCWDLVQQLRSQYDSASLQLYLCTMPDGTRHLSVMPLTYEAATVTPYPSPQEGVAAFYDAAVQHASLAHMRRQLHSLVRRRRHKLHTRRENLCRDRGKLEGYLPYQHYGTLLVAQKIPRGATHATVTDYSHPEQPTLQIPLEPALSIRDNAQVYFKKYRKAKTGLDKVEALLAQCAAQDADLHSLEAEITHAADRTTLQTLASMLGDTARGAARQPPRTSSVPAAAPPYRTFKSSDGYTLLCGKSDRGNEVLLRRLAAPDDVWLHAQHYAGTHVMIKVHQPGEVPQRTLLEAAGLAAFYSQGKHAAAVDVMYTPARQVHKFRGSRAGQVTVDTYRTLQVAPRLLDT